MSGAYTDADVQALMNALGCRMGTYAGDPACWKHDVMQFDGTTRCPHAIEALDAVAPAIAARALREFATDRVTTQTAALMREDLCDYADELDPPVTP